MSKVANDIVGFFSIIFKAIGSFLLAVLKAIWFPFGVILKFLAELLRGFAKAASIVAIAVAGAIAGAVKAIGKGIAAACKGIVHFCKTKPIATIVLYVLGWSALGFVLPTLYIWDASFYSRQASPVLPVLTYIAVGLTFRTIVVVGLPFIIRAVRRREWLSAGSWTFLWLISIPACFLAAMGAVTEGQDYHFRNASAIVETKDVSVDSFDEQIKRIEGEKERERIATDTLIAGARRSMSEVTNDGDPTNDDLTAFEASIRQYTTDGTNRQQQLDDQIAVLEATKLTARTTASDKAVIDPPIAAVYEFPARYVPAVQPMAFRDSAAVYWVVGLEIIGFLLPGTLYAAHIITGQRVPLPKHEKARQRRRFRWPFWNTISDMLFEKLPDPPPPNQPTPEEEARAKLEREEAELRAAIANAENEKRVAQLRAELEALRNPPPPAPPPPPPPGLTPQQQALENARRAAELARAAAAGQTPYVPVGDWRGRPDRLNGAQI